MISLAAAQWAAAGSFGVAPIRVELRDTHRIESVTVRNQSDAPLLLQTRAVAWSQDNGEERTVDTHELLVTPLIVQIAPHGEQVLRVALRRDADPSRELDYRVLFTEVAPADDAESQQGQGLRVALQLSVPVFVNPAAPVQAQLHWQARTLADGSVQVAAANLGNAHAQITGFDLMTAADAPLAHASAIRYVLPGSEMSWNLMPAVSIAADTPLAVQGQSDSGAFKSEVDRAGP
ncbi:MAG TPA: fimbria/pilus periplasmic chaperone [Steroidobacteraceae bacterium]|nr:fimbria/pilus periplasmic chaperone [Steroidobacteraceae bacterium]